MPAILPDIPTAEAAIIERTNKFRAEHHLGAVRFNVKLATAARDYASYLAATDQFSHTADGRQAGDRVASTGYAWCHVSENLAMHLDSRGFDSYVLAEKAVQGWINSPGHRANLLAPEVTEIGVGIARAPGEDPKYLSVQLFARPQDLQYQFQISNNSSEAVIYSFGGEQHTLEPRYDVTHTACNPGDVWFDAIGTGPNQRPLSLHYRATDGTRFVLRAAFGEALDIEITSVAGNSRP